MRYGHALVESGMRLNTLPQYHAARLRLPNAACFEHCPAGDDELPPRPIHDLEFLNANVPMDSARWQNRNRIRGISWQENQTEAAKSRSQQDAK